MEATEKRIPLQLRRMLGTRSGTFALAGGIAALAAIVLVVFLGQYRDNVRGGTAPVTAVVAGSLIPKGTSGDVVIGDKLFESTTVPQDELKSGALADTASIAGRVAVHDIYPGQQLTAADFASKSDPLRGKLSGDQRAVAIPVDAAHGLTKAIRAGDRVDVLAGFNTVSSRSGAGRPVVRTLFQDILVLSTPSGGNNNGGDDKGNVMLRVDDKQAAALAFASDNGKVWLALRPPAGASRHTPTMVDLDALLAGSPALGVSR